MHAKFPRAVLLVSRDQPWCEHLIGCVTDLGLPHRVIAPDKVRHVRPGLVTCLDPPSVLELASACPPSVLVFTHSTTNDEILAFVNVPGVVAVDIEELSPMKLLEATMGATLGISTQALEAYLASTPSLKSVPLFVIEAFLRTPRSMKSHRNLCHVLRATRSVTHTALRKMGFGRAEHLWTQLRAETWIWFATQGVNRAVFEEYLGIKDRHNFKRACRRAGVHPPWQSAASR